MIQGERRELEGGVNGGLCRFSGVEVCNGGDNGVVLWVVMKMEVGVGCSLKKKRKRLCSSVVWFGEEEKMFML